MAARIPVNLELEEKICKSVTAIDHYMTRYLKEQALKEKARLLVHAKNVEMAPVAWHDPGDAYILIIGPYYLDEEKWGEWGNGVDLDCHFDTDGHLRRVYCRL